VTLVDYLNCIAGGHMRSRTTVVLVPPTLYVHSQTNLPVTEIVERELTSTPSIAAHNKLVLRVAIISAATDLDIVFPKS